MRTVTAYSDSELLELLRNGSKEAFTQLYATYSERLYHILLRMVKSPDIAEELLQDVFIRIWEKRATINVQSSLGAYLNKIGENIVYDFFRKAARDRSLYAQLENYMERVTEPAAAPVDGGEDLLNKAIEELPPQRRQVFRLCKLEGQSYQQVSLLLGISVSTVNDHIVKATKTLQKNISGRIVSIAVCMLLTGIR
ncbi:RNA polymerase sigma factor [Chitinophaga cymbidii]|uniref:RNA polymerase sigma factor n=1 Tax=Chitinophaga cymbidii TaxID=1096750 RepID=A0A512RT09_9BACT|nr:sigma-70 family RNA polymerase sigma factor [Chitinophaga cymbidii]GEP98829.1 RNA polymerase sigma factor [Chitinophaga cymbidii]